MNIHWSGTLQQTWLGRGRAKPRQRLNVSSLSFNYSEPEDDDRSTTDNQSPFYASSPHLNLTVTNGSVHLMPVNSGGEKGFLRRGADPSMHHPAAAMDHQKTTMTTTMLLPRLHASMAVLLIAGLFFCFTLFATIAVGVFCRKRNTVFVFQKSQQDDYEEEDEDNYDGEEDDEEEEMERRQQVVRLSGTDDSSSSCGDESDQDDRLHGDAPAGSGSSRGRKQSKSHRLQRIAEEDQDHPQNEAHGYSSRPCSTSCADLTVPMSPSFPVTYKGAKKKKKRSESWSSVEEDVERK